MSLPKFSEQFTGKALQLFEFQFEHNAVYREFCTHLSRTPAKVKELAEIPFLPIEFFKTHRVYGMSTTPELEFHSSGTTQGTSNRSTHWVDKKERYHESILKGFQEFNKDSGQKVKLFALLPGYMENQYSSLLYMIDYLNRSSCVDLMGYYISDFQRLKRDINFEKGKEGVTIMLWGVSFALLDFAQEGGCDLSGHRVLETGGMKGRRKEMVRDELHRELMEAFNVTEIGSEYGMTELLSQAYSYGKGIFYPSETMGVLTRDVYDPLSCMPTGERGAVNVIDLSNQHSCSFIATQDLGTVYADGSFEILGRLDQSDVRGCNLLAI